METNNTPDRTTSSDPVIDGAALIDLIAATITRFVVLPAKTYVIALALWVLHTWTFDAARTTPYIIVTSPEKESGKTTLLEVLGALAAKTWAVVSPTPAVLFRKIAADRPTLMIDEVDGIFGGLRARGEAAAGIRDVVNAGNRRGAVIPRCVGKDHEPTDFEVFCPKALVGLHCNGMPDTVLGRSIVLPMKRRHRDEPIERWHWAQADQEFAALRDRMRRWAEAHLEELRLAAPEPVEGLGDRAFDGWEPLFAVAEAAGGRWPDRARRAAIALSAQKQTDERSIGVRLLSDIRHAFTRARADRIKTEDLLRDLNAQDTSPWGAWHKGGGESKLTARDLANLLRRYDIVPSSIRFPDGTTPKGYLREQFEDAWGRYLPASGSTDPQHRHNTDDQTGSTVLKPSRPEGPDPASVQGCGGVADPATMTPAEAADQATTPEATDAELNPFLDSNNPFLTHERSKLAAIAAYEPFFNPLDQEAHDGPGDEPFDPTTSDDQLHGHGEA